MELLVGNKIITEPIVNILTLLRQETGNFYFKSMKETSDHIKVTCPFHKDGQENHPSCTVVTSTQLDNFPPGLFHCFTCGVVASLPQVVGHCFGQDEKFGVEWLVERFGNTFIQHEDWLEPIELTSPTTETYMDESVLRNYDCYHPYITSRGISEYSRLRFKIGYDKESSCITFPVWDIHNNLVMITKRNVNTKRFYIQEGVSKPVYLLNFMLQDNVNFVYVCESQINALTLLSWGYPAVALIGTGTKEQYSILNKCGIRNYILCFDGDEAGDKGCCRFEKNIRKDCVVMKKILPRGKDVNDLTKEQFDNLKMI